jgi:RNA polymerase sigma factor for flagellar operon FliA
MRARLQNLNKLFAAKAQGKVSLRDRLVSENLHLVNQVVNKFSHFKNSEIEEDDLIGYGIIGLLEAASKYNDEKGKAFAAFALPRIRGAILDQLRVRDVLSRTSRKKVRSMTTFINEFEMKNGQPPTDEEIASGLSVSLDELYNIQREASINTFSLNANLSEDSEESWIDQLSDEANTPEENCVNTLFKDALTKAIGELPERERLIVGLYHYKEFTMKQIADYLKVSESRACQLHNRAVSLLRCKLEVYCG